MEDSSPFYSVRIVAIDYYLTQANKIPYKDYEKLPQVVKVPVVRVYGPNGIGQKTCVHLHGALPYFYLGLEATLVPDKTSLKRFLKELEIGLNIAIDESLSRDVSVLGARKHVFRLTLVKGVPFYGYCNQEEVFIKVFLYNPDFLKRAAKLLQEGVFRSRKFDTFESHVPFILQFMMDYNLYGMNYIHFDTVKFRQPLLTSAAMGTEETIPCSSTEHLNPSIVNKNTPFVDFLKSKFEDTHKDDLWDLKKLPNEFHSSLAKTNRIEIEIDALAEEILNRKLLGEPAKGTPTEDTLDKDMCNVSSLLSLWKDEEKNRKLYGLTDPIVSEFDDSSQRDIDIDSMRIRDLRSRIESILREKNFLSLSNADNPEEIKNMDSTTNSPIHNNIGAFDNFSEKATKAACSSQDFSPESFRTGYFDQEDDSFSQLCLAVEDFRLTPQELDQENSIPKTNEVKSVQEVRILHKSQKKELQKSSGSFSCLGSSSLENGSEAKDTETTPHSEINRTKRKFFNTTSNEIFSPNCNNNHDSKPNLDSGKGTRNSSLNNNNRFDASSSTQNCDNNNNNNCDSDSDSDDYFNNDVHHKLISSLTVDSELAKSLASDDNSEFYDYFDNEDNDKNENDIEEADSENDYLCDENNEDVCIDIDETNYNDDDARDDAKDERIRLDETISCDTFPAIAQYDGSNDIPGRQKKEDIQNQRKRSYDNLLLDEPDSKEMMFNTNINCINGSHNDSRGKVELEVFLPKNSNSKQTIHGSNDNLTEFPFTVKAPHEFSSAAMSLWSPTQEKDICLDSPPLPTTPSSNDNMLSADCDLIKVDQCSGRFKLVNQNHQLSSGDLAGPKELSKKSCVSHFDSNDFGHHDDYINNDDNGSNDRNIGDISPSKSSKEFTSLNSTFALTNKEKVNITNENTDDSFPTATMLDSSSTMTPLSTNDCFQYFKAPPTINHLNEKFHSGEMKEVFYQQPYYRKHEDRKYCKTVIVGAHSINIKGDSLPPPFPGLHFSSRQSEKGSHEDYLYPISCRKSLSSLNLRQISKRFIFTPFDCPPSLKRLLSHSAKKNLEEEKLKSSDNKQENVLMHHSRSRRIKPQPKNNPMRCTDNCESSSYDSSKIRPSASQIGQRTPSSTFDGYGFRFSGEDINDTKKMHEYQDLTILSVEIHAASRKDLLSDPKHDEVLAVVFCIADDKMRQQNKTDYLGAIVVTSGQEFVGKKIAGCQIENAPDEATLFKRFILLVQNVDPDFLIGFEIQKSSWGYLLERAQLQFNLDLENLLSRSIENLREASDIPSIEKNEYEYYSNSGIRIKGRIVLNVWRRIRGEIALNNYSFENLMYHIVHKRIPKFPQSRLSHWFRPVSDREHQSAISKWRVIQYYIIRARGTIQILDALHFISRKSEFARIYGIDFFSILCRGSQYKVEAMMLRVTKAYNYISVSPSKEKVAGMNAPECLPIIMEPQSRFYTSPVLVLDFQSLYPSIIIAYNYCYSTCLGRVSDDEYKKLGTQNINIPHSLLNKLQHSLVVSPNGIMFTNKKIRTGILPLLLSEILQTRIMIKKSMKLHNKENKALMNTLDSRQFGLKMIANVTYGYTSANYSGRMPCVEVADSIVETGRQTLQKAIDLVNNNKEWHGSVVYGDTDSLFVSLPGASKETAFRIGREIAEAVTKMNPYPVALKFDKVYLPCVLQSKKRYCGYKYESEDQTSPEFEAKGIETVRRDTCSATAKVLEKSIRLLFETKDLSCVKDFVQEQFRKLEEGRVSMQDLIIAKEVKLAKYKDPTKQPVAVVSNRAMDRDHRAEPRYRERVPYVVVNGTFNSRLVDQTRSPYDVLKDPSLVLNSKYYITKQIIPPLDRIFSLLGVNVSQWYRDMPHIERSIVTDDIFLLNRRRITIDSYYKSSHCIRCREQCHNLLCASCLEDQQTSTFSLMSRLREIQRSAKSIFEVCSTCIEIRDPDIGCVSLDCPVFYERNKIERDQRFGEFVIQKALKELTP